MASPGHRRWDGSHGSASGVTPTVKTTRRTVSGKEQPGLLYSRPGGLNDTDCFLSKILPRAFFFYLFQHFFHAFDESLVESYTILFHAGISYSPSSYFRLLNIYQFCYKNLILLAHRTLSSFQFHYSS
jgi:hypothetical protein